MQANLLHIVDLSLKPLDRSTYRPTGGLKRLKEIIFKEILHIKTCMCIPLPVTIHSSLKICQGLYETNVQSVKILTIGGSGDENVKMPC